MKRLCKNILLVVACFCFIFQAGYFFTVGANKAGGLCPIEIHYMEQDHAQAQ